MTTLIEKVETLLTGPLHSMGYEIVRIQMTGGKNATLQIMADRLDESDVTVNDCEAISNTASALLDVEDFIADRYFLEVSSPGLDRPLIKLKDFKRFEDHVARIEMREGQGIDGRKKFQGTLKGVEDAVIKIECDGETYALPHGEVARAQLVITDDVFRASLKKGKATEKDNKQKNKGKK